MLNRVRAPRQIGAQSVTAGAAPTLSPIEELGKRVFFDNISRQRMACVTCHLPETGGTGGVSGVNLHQVAITGANPHTLGNIKPPTNAYASYIEEFKRCGRGGLGAPTFAAGT
jgi:cytochrome c peroxidase